MRTHILAVAFVGVIVMSGTTGLAQTCVPDIVLVGGRVHTVDAALPEAEAIAICGERVGAIGTTRDIRALAGSRTRVIELQGKLVVPGFNDAHVHTIDGADELVGVNLRPAKDEADLAGKLGEFVQRMPKGR